MRGRLGQTAVVCYSMLHYVNAMSSSSLPDARVDDSGKTTYTGLARSNIFEPIAIAFSSSTSSDYLNEGVWGALIWIVVILEITLMSALAIISIIILHESLKPHRQTATFIKKLLMLIIAVSIGGVVNAVHEAPWWKNQPYF